MATYAPEMSYSEREDIETSSEGTISRTNSIDKLPLVANADPDKPKWWIPKFLKMIPAPHSTKNNGQTRFRGSEQYARIPEDN